MNIHPREGENPFARATPGKRINPPRIIALYFAATITAAAALLMLPTSSVSGRAINWVDALFTATSATCVTGLTVVDIGRDFTHFGQVVVLACIQAGGLGIMTFSTAFMLLLGKRLSFRSHVVIQGSMAQERFVSLRSLIGYAIMTTFAFELIGTVILYHHFVHAYGLSPFMALYHGVFHCISAFCNAGFSLYPDNLSRFSRDFTTVITLGLLIIVGGFGFSVIMNILSYRFRVRSIGERSRLTLQTKTVLSTSAMLIGLMVVCILVLEWRGTLVDYSVGEKILNAWFHAITPRTAGFNTLPIALMGNHILFLTICMMFIGASPGSTGGGIKTCTFAVLVAVSRSIMKGEREVRLMGRSLGKNVIAEAICISFFSLILVIGICTLLLVSERALVVSTPQKGHLINLLFETVSAFGTVGLSTGVTSSLTTLGKIIICFTMYAGRIGPLTLALIIARREPLAPAIHYPEEDIMIG